MEASTKSRPDLPGILRLPTDIRVYIFGLSGLGSKLSTIEEVPWATIELEPGRPVADVRNTLGYSDSADEKWQAFDAIRGAAPTQAFRHPLYKVSRQFRMEARCALLKYNVIQLIADEESITWYGTWPSEYYKALQEISIVAFHDGSIEQLVRLLRANSDFPNLRVHIQEGLGYDTLWEDVLHLKPGEAPEKEEDYEKLLPQWMYFRGVKDLFLYYASLFRLEIKHEKMIMGDDYDSEAHGKLSPAVRDSDHPWCKSEPPEPMLDWE